MKESRRQKISIIIPTCNGGHFLKDLLAGIFSQAVLPDEVIIIDSCSTDCTVDSARKFAAASYPVKLMQVPKADFGHGKTRNLAASCAEGDLLVFVTQDALPAHPQWLKNLTEPFLENDDAACVFGRHLPRPGCNPIIARDIEKHFRSFGSEPYLRQKVDWTDRSDVEKYRKRLGWYCFNSNVNSAVRKSAWEKIRFKDVIYAEDQLFGKDVIEAGYAKIYARHAEVFHSHSYSLLDFFRRYFDEYRGRKISLKQGAKSNLFLIVPVVMAATLIEIFYIIRSTENRKLFWCLYAPLYHLCRQSGAWLGEHYERIPIALQKLLSLEGQGVQR